MNIACATDDNYVQHCGVMLTSLFENNKGEGIHIYLLTAGLSENNRVSLENIVKYYNGTFHYCLLSHDLIKDFPQGGANPQITLASYNRFFLPQYLPETETKVIYLDCDLVVCSSLKSMWETDITGYALGAIEEYWDLLNGNVEERANRLQYDVRYSYFNAGVLLINIAYWRKEDVTQKLLEYIIDYPERIVWHDQDALNAILHAHWLKLAGKWNVTPYVLQRVIKIPLDYLPMRTEAILEPGIIHFCSSPKPWVIGCCHPLRKEYYKYLRLTQWKDFHPSDWYKTTRHFVGNILRSLGIKEATMMSFSDVQKLRKKQDRNIISGSANTKS